MRSCMEPQIEGDYQWSCMSSIFLQLLPQLIFFNTKLLAYCRFTLPSLLQVYNFLPGVLRQVFGLGHG